MNKILITGGSGFIGWWLSFGDFEEIHLLNSKSYFADWDQDKWDAIIHLAPIPVDRVIECARRCKATVLLASSGGVYDRNPDDYFRMKLEDERKLLDSGLNVKIARIFTTCGAYMNWKRYAIGNFIMQAAQGKPLEVQSYGKVVRSYIYCSDLAEWLWKILLNGAPGGIYNVGSDEPHSMEEIAFEVASHFDPMPQIDIQRKLQYEPRPFYIPDITRARDEMGLEIKVSFKEAVAKTVVDYRNEYP